MYLVRLTRIINASLEKPWSQLLCVTWKKPPRSTPPSSVVNIELWITQWQACRDRESGAELTLEHKAPSQVCRKQHIHLSRTGQMGLFKCRIVWERDIQVSLEAARYISISVLFSNVDLFTFILLCLFKFSLEQVI